MCLDPPVALRAEGFGGCATAPKAEMCTGTARVSARLEAHGMLARSSGQCGIAVQKNSARGLHVVVA